MTYGQQPRLKLTYRYWWLWVIFEYSKPDYYVNRATKLLLYLFGYMTNVNGCFFHVDKIKKMVVDKKFIETSSLEYKRNHIIYRSKNLGITCILIAAILSK